MFESCKKWKSVKNVFTNVNKSSKWGNNPVL